MSTRPKKKAATKPKDPDAFPRLTVGIVYEGEQARTPIHLWLKNVGNAIAQSVVVHNLILTKRVIEFECFANLLEPGEIGTAQPLLEDTGVLQRNDPLEAILKDWKEADEVSETHKLNLAVSYQDLDGQGYLLYADLLFYPYRLLHQRLRSPAPILECRNFRYEMEKP